jgi:hypothetical protein
MYDNCKFRPRKNLSTSNTRKVKPQKNAFINAEINEGRLCFPNPSHFRFAFSEICAQVKAICGIVKGATFPLLSFSLLFSFLYYNFHKAIYTSPYDSTHIIIRIGILFLCNETMKLLGTLPFGSVSSSFSTTD